MAKVKDPVCGRTIESDKTATQSRFEGETYFFCSLACAREFNNNPSRYAGAESLERHGQPEYEAVPEMHDKKKTEQ